MKKIVFLICLLLLFTPLEVSADEVYTCGDDRIINDEEWISTNGHSHMVAELTKSGVHPFQLVLFDPDISYFINDVSCIEDQYIIFGYSTDFRTDTAYDGLFMVLDLDGNIISEKHIEHEFLEEVKQVYYFDQTYGLIITQTVDINESFEFMTNYVELYNTEFELLDVIEVANVIHGYKVENNILLIDYGYDSIYEIGVKSDSTILLPTDILNVQSTYEGSAKIDFINKAILNNTTVYNGIEIDYPGTYSLLYNQQEYNFIVNPIIEGVVNSGVYLDDVSVTYSSGNGMLNKEPYISSEIIDLPGNYLFELHGVNDYVKQIQFTITPSIEGVINGHAYNNQVIIEFEGDGYLNNNFVSSPLTVDEYGDYVLKVNGVGGYLETYEFSVIGDEAGSNLNWWISNLDIFLVVVVVVSGVIIIKKK